MGNPMFIPPAENDGILYEIKIKGHLAPHWSDWIGDLKITHDGTGNTILTGIVQDQSALHGILTQIRNLGLDLISVRPLNDDEEERKS